MDVHVEWSDIPLINCPELPDGLEELYDEIRRREMVKRSINYLHKYGTLVEISAQLGVTVRAVHLWLSDQRCPQDIGICLRLSLWERQQKTKVKELSQTLRPVITSKS